VYAYLRFDPASGQRFLVLANLHPHETLHEVQVRLPREAVAFLEISADSALRPVERLAETQSALTLANAGDGAVNARAAELPPLTAFYVELRVGE
jgi:hypothetical protein